MRILVLGDGRQPHTRRWIQALQESGSEVVAASMESPSEPLPCPFHLLPASGPGFLRHRAALPPLLAIAREFKPRCITSLFVPDYGFLGARLRKSMGHEAGPSLCVAALGSDLLINAHRTPLHRLRARWVLQQADVVAVDARVLGEAAISLGAAPAKIHRLYWMPDLLRFSMQPDPPDSPRRVVSTRQLDRLYDVGTLLEAMRPLFLQRGSEVELVVAGDGPERSRLEERARQLGGRVHFTGRLAPLELAELLQSATVYVSTAHSDSTSVSLLEAMACGAFPVTTSIPGNREWVTEGNSGLLFTSGNSGNLAHQIARALDDRMLRERAIFYNRRKLEALPPFQDGIRQLLSRFSAA